MTRPFILDTRAFLTAAIYQSAGIFLVGMLLKSYRLGSIFSPTQLGSQTSFLTRENYLLYVGTYWLIQVAIGVYLAKNAKSCKFMHVLLLNWILWLISLASLFFRPDLQFEPLMLSLLNVLAVSSIGYGVYLLLFPKK